MNSKLVKIIMITVFSTTSLFPMGYYLGYKGFQWLFSGTKSIEEAYWDANKSEFEQKLQQFKDEKSEHQKAEILKSLMSKKSTEYRQQIIELQNKIDELESNYRKIMSHIVQKFQNESPNSTIFYLPDTQLLTMFPKNASDQEKLQKMNALFAQANTIIQKQKTSNAPSITPSSSAAASTSTTNFPSIQNITIHNPASASTTP